MTKQLKTKSPHYGSHDIKIEMATPMPGLDWHAAGGVKKWNSEYM
jgi:hypothetical protein